MISDHPRTGLRRSGGSKPAQGGRSAAVRHAPEGGGCTTTTLLLCHLPVLPQTFSGYLERGEHDNASADCQRTTCSCNAQARCCSGGQSAASRRGCCSTFHGRGNDTYLHCPIRSAQRHLEQPCGDTPAMAGAFCRTGRRDVSEHDIHQMAPSSGQTDWNVFCAQGHGWTAVCNHTHDLFHIRSRRLSVPHHHHSHPAWINTPQRSVHHDGTVCSVRCVLSLFQCDCCQTHPRGRLLWTSYQGQCGYTRPCFCSEPPRVDAPASPNMCLPLSDTVGEGGAEVRQDQFKPGPASDVPLHVHCARFGCAHPCSKPGYCWFSEGKPTPASPLSLSLRVVHQHLLSFAKSAHPAM